MTEKNYNPEQKNAKTLDKQKKAVIQNPEVKTPKVEKKAEEIKKAEVKKSSKQVVKKEFAEINSHGVPISTLDAIYICNFIKNKTIEKAISDLELVIKKKKAVPMKGEIPHRKGKGMMSGRFPVNSSIAFITLLNGLKGNSNVNGIEEPIISEAIANFAPRPRGRFGRTQKKRTHVRLVSINKKQKTENKK